MICLTEVVLNRDNLWYVCKTANNIICFNSRLNFINLKVYYKDLNFETLQEKPEYDVCITAKS